MRFLLVPDSFKDSISAEEIVTQLEKGFEEVDASISCASYIASDGGEGFLEVVYRYLEVIPVTTQTSDPLGRSIWADYAIDSVSKTIAYIELAKASGLELLSAKDRNPMYTSTFGTGLQLKDALDSGVQQVYVGLGGSATNDGGVGIGAALGYSFFNKEGVHFVPTGKSLRDIHRIERAQNLDLPEVIAINDVQNVLTGPAGAAHTYARQKGASDEEILFLDEGLLHLAAIVQRDLELDKELQPGVGAAGGSGYGLHVFCNARFIPGTQFFATISGIEQRLKDGLVDVIITGEGSIDHQTAQGKLVKGMALLGKKYNVPVMAVCGVNTLSEPDLQKLGISAVFAVSDLATSLADSMENVEGYVRQLSRKLYNHYLQLVKDSL